MKFLSVVKTPLAIYRHISIIDKSFNLPMIRNKFPGQTNVWKLYVTHERVRTHHITVGRYCDLLGLDISLLYGKGFIRTAIASIIEGY